MANRLRDRTKFLLIFLFLVGMISSPKLSAQQSEFQYRSCPTVIKPDVAQETLKRPKNYKSKNSNNGKASSQFSATTADTNVLIIPVVFHVIHCNEPYGIGTNILDSLLKGQIRILNEDYRKKPFTLGFNNNTVGADARIEFQLATYGPDFNPTTGITRVYGKRPISSLWSISENDSLKSLSRWPTNKYLNIWVCNLTDYLGYAQFPVTDLNGLQSVPVTDSLTDGIVIGYRYLGNTPSGNYNKGRTATHEIGHYLGLIHIWGDGFDCTATDYCADTPSQIGPTNGCPSNPNTCPNDRPGPDMVGNYLNFSNDVCMNIFTNDQVGRMRHVLKNSPRRTSLLASYGLNALPKPIIRNSYFTASIKDANLLMHFNDYDTGTTTIAVYDLTGKVVLKPVIVPLASSSEVISLPLVLPTSIYLIKVVSPLGIVTRKISN